MSKFVLKSIEGVKGKQLFKQLIILDDYADAKKIQKEIDAKFENNDKDKKADKIGQLDIYEKKLEKKYKSSFRGILAIMNRVANLQPVPKMKFKDVTPKGELINEYEFKMGDLRVFAIKIPNGKLIILGGYKNTQPQDFNKFRSLKKQYLEYHNHK